MAAVAADPAILGGTPAFPEPLPFARPFTPPLEQVVARLAPSYERGQLTNGPLVRELEGALAERLGVRHAVAVSCCTAGLMLALRAVADGGPVVLPSFTFSASAHAVAWTGAVPVFCECNPVTFSIDVADAEARATESGGRVFLATHVFGAPAPVDALEALGRRMGAALVFDAAHGLGATQRDRPVGGFGTAEVFSLSPTKLVVAGEGGIVATNHDELAETVRIGRDYANPGDYDTRFVGLNARMSELHAALALESLALLDEHLARRRTRADRYRELVAGIPGLSVQHIDDGDRSTFKDFTIAIDADRFGLGRDTLVAALRADGVDTRCYFSPPVHRQQAYRHLETDLPVTDTVAGSVISLPMYGTLPLDAVDRIGAVLAALHERAEEISELAMDPLQICS